MTPKILQLTVVKEMNKGSIASDTNNLFNFFVFFPSLVVHI